MWTGQCFIKSRVYSPYVSTIYPISLLLSGVQNRYLYVTEVYVLSWECLARCMSYINRHSFPGHCEVRVQSLAPNGGNLISDVGYFNAEQLERHTSVSLCVCLFIQCVCCDIIIWRVLSISLGTDGRPHNTTSRQIFCCLVTNMGFCLWPIFRLKSLLLGHLIGWASAYLTPLKMSQHV